MNYLFFTSIAILLWSSLAYLVTQLNHVPPFLLLAISLILGGSLSIVKYRSWKLQWSLIVFGVCGIFGYHLFLFLALRFAPAVEANLINYLWPLLIILMAPLILKDNQLTRYNIFGGLLGFSGAALLIANKNGLNLSPDYFLGYLLAVLAALTWASYSLLSKRLPHFSSATVGLFCLLSGLISLAIHFGFEDTPNLTDIDWLFLILLGIGPMGIAFYCWDLALKNGDAKIIGTLSYLTPLLSTLLLVLMSNRQFDGQLLLAISLIVGGAFIGSKKIK